MSPEGAVDAPSDTLSIALALDKGPACCAASNAASAKLPPQVRGELTIKTRLGGCSWGGAHGAGSTTGSMASSPNLLAVG